MKLLPEELRRSGGLSTLSPSGPDDIFIVCASFEPRTFFAAENLSPEYRAKRSLVYVNQEFLVGHPGALTRPNLFRLIECMARRSEKVDVANGSWLSEVDQIKAIKHGLGFDDGSETGPERVTLDCTTFNRESLLTLLLLLRSRWPTCRVRVVYTSPDEHGSWLSRGFRGIRNVMGFCGTQAASKPTILAVLSGFESHRTQKVVEEHEPSKLLLGVGDPPTAPEFLERNRVEQSLMLSRQDVVRFDFDAGDIQNCRNALHSVLEPYLDTANVVIAPMSTKFSTIAALLVAEAHPQVQITYCVPGEYNIYDYSKGVNAIFVEELPKASKGM